MTDPTLPRESDPVEMWRDRIIAAMPWYDEADPDYTELDTVIEAAIRSRPVEVDPERLDPRVVEAFDLLGGMWSWYEAPDRDDFLAHGTTWYHMAGRVLREVVGRPAQPPAVASPALSSPEPRKP